MVNQTYSLKEYLLLKPDQRYDYLRLNVSSSTDLSVDFCMEAFNAESDDYCKWYLIRALGIIGDPIAVKTLLSVCQTHNVNLDQSSIYSIAALSLGLIGKPAFEATYELLKSKDLNSKCFAADALGEIKDPRAVDGLCSILKHDEMEVRYWAALSLSKIGKVSLPCLAEILRVGINDSETSLLVLDAILKIGDVSSSSLIEWVLENGSIDQKRWYLSRGVKSFWNDRIKELTRRISESNEELSALAKDAMNQPILDSSKG